MNIIMIIDDVNTELINMNNVTGIHKTGSTIYFHFVGGDTENNYSCFTTNMELEDVKRKLNNSSTLDLRRCDDQDSDVHR